jgi:hypothetical protein
MSFSQAFDRQLFARPVDQKPTREHLVGAAFGGDAIEGPVAATAHTGTIKCREDSL